MRRDRRCGWAAIRDEIYEAEGLPGLAALSLQVMRMAFVGVRTLKAEPEGRKKKRKPNPSPSPQSDGA